MAVLETQMNTNNLEKELKNWFDTVNWKKANIFTRDPVAKLLKEELSKIKRWKNFGPGRAASKKGFEAFLRSRNGGEENDRNDE